MNFSGRNFIYFLVLHVARHSKSNVRKSNSIELNPWIEFDWVRQSNEIEHRTFSEFDFRTNRTQSNKSNPIEPNQSDWVRLGSVTELIRTQLNGLRSIGSGKPIHTKQTFRKQGFLAFFNSLFNNRNPCPHLREQNRTEQKYRNSRVRIQECTISFLS